jgi:hypothetical protein
VFFTCRLEFPAEWYTHSNVQFCKLVFEYNNNNHTKNKTRVYLGMSPFLSRAFLLPFVRDFVLVLASRLGSSQKASPRQRKAPRKRALRHTPRREKEKKNVTFRFFRFLSLSVAFSRRFGKTLFLWLPDRVNHACLAITASGVCTHGRLCFGTTTTFPPSLISHTHSSPIFPHIPGWDGANFILLSCSFGERGASSFIMQLHLTRKRKSSEMYPRCATLPRSRVVCVSFIVDVFPRSPHTLTIHELVLPCCYL